jgi:hypothetical protein
MSLLMTFHFISDSSLYNYADDNTLSFCNPDFDALISTLGTDSNQLIEWFRINKIVLSLNNFMFGEFVDRIHPVELEIKDNTYTDRSASYLDLHLEIDSERLVYCLWC